MGNEQMTEYKEKHDDLMNSNNEKARQVARMEEKLTNAEKEHKFKEKIIQEKIAELSVKTEQSATLEQTVAQLTDKTRTIENEKMALEDKNESLTSDVGWLKKQTDDEKKANADLRETLVGLKDQIKEGEMKCMQLSKEVKRRDETLKEEKEKLAVKSKVEAELKVSKDKNTEQANEITALTMQLDGTKAHIASLQSAVKANNEEKEKLSNESKSTMKHLSDRREENAALGEQVKALKGQLDTEKTNNSKLSKTCDELKREIKEETAKGNNAEIKITALEKDVKSLTLKTEQQQATIDSLQEEVRLYRETMEAPKERETDIKVLETEKKHISMHFDEQTQVMEALSSDKAKLLEQNSDLRETVACFKEQEVSLKVSLDHAEKEVTELKERMQILEKEKRTREKELSEKHSAEMVTIRNEHMRQDDSRNAQSKDTTEAIKAMHFNTLDIMHEQNQGVRNCLEKTSEYLFALTGQSQRIADTCLRLQLEARKDNGGKEEYSSSPAVDTQAHGLNNTH